MILYQTVLSSYSLKVRLALALKGCSVELREPPEGSYRSAAYRALVPAATVPALVDGRVVLTESDAIIEYVEETRNGALLLPPDPAGRARARMMSRLCDLRLEASLRRLFPMIKSGTALVQGDISPAREAWLLLGAIADPDGPFACGPAPTLPDCGVAAALVWLDLLGRDLPGPAEPARLRLWRDAIDTESRWQDMLRAYRATARAWIGAQSPG
ncbi:MAG: glutathione S-transferase family protein [Alsobacter sp.]